MHEYKIFYRVCDAKCAQDAFLFDVHTKELTSELSYHLKSAGATTTKEARVLFWSDLQYTMVDLTGSPHGLNKLRNETSSKSLGWIPVAATLLYVYI